MGNTQPQLGEAHSEGFNVDDRIVSTFAALEKNHSRVVIITERPETIAKEYVLYNRLYSSADQAKKINAAFIAQEQTNAIAIDNVIFSSDPKTIKPESADTFIVKNNIKFDPMLLPGSTRKLMIVPILADGGDIFRIYNGKTCSQYTLKTYPYGIRFADLAIEKLSEEHFCTTFITKLLGQ